MNITASELRTKYLKFFESKGHLIHASDSLVPDDPSLLYTAAGMVQFKPYFIGDRVPPKPRIVTSQKCIRTDDVDEVGDAVHHTFFEMLGNFSFGDYFKREAITWAWEFLTEVLGLNPDLLWTSVYLTDDEAFDIWTKEVGFPAERIVRLGEDKNYWPADAPSKGPNGPCGPCNEIFLDVKPELGMPEDPAWSIAHDGNRFVEIWNLVFQQYDRQDDGKLVPLPTQNIDTGMGLERTIAVLQGTATNYETDLFLPIIRGIEKISGVTYGKDESTDRSIRVIADHIRAAVFAIADGVMPSNVGRGHVLRRVIRRAVLQGNNLGIDKPFMHELVAVVADLMKDAYPEPKERQDYVTSLVKAEEEKFRRTLDGGMARLTQQLEDVKKSGQKMFPGDAAFVLHDTYGFPLELTQEIARNEGIDVDIAAFESAMEEQRQKAKEGSDFASALFGGEGGAIAELEKTIDGTNFVGYTELESDSTVLAIIEQGELASVAKEGRQVELVLDVTPFYAESGGQVGDTGEITAAGAVIKVKNTLKASKFSLHVAEVVSGEIKVGDKVHATVDKARRMDIQRNHTATHLLHAALRTVLGPHALQSGSVVDPSRLRFDFSHFQAVTPEELRQIEDMVNEKILEDIPAELIETSVDEARKLGAMALFGEKYGNVVRVMKVGDYSIELCGGTHLHRTSEVGFIKILSESSVGAGLRRIEAVTGRGAVARVHEIEDMLRDVADKLGANPAGAAEAVERLQGNLKDAQKQIEQIQAKSASAKAQELAESAIEISGVKVVAAKLDTTDAQALSTLADAIADRLKSCIIIIIGKGEKLLLVSKVTPDLVKSGYHAGNIVKEAAKVAGGGGGGRPDFAQAGGKDLSKVDEALAAAVEVIRAKA